MTLQQIHYIIVIAETGSMNKAAEQLYIAQPSLTSAVKELEKEIGITIFNRSGKGVSLTADGTEFLVYARQLYQQYETLYEKYSDGKIKRKFGVSAQHYSFAVHAFVETVKEYNTTRQSLCGRNADIFFVRLNRIFESILSYGEKIMCRITENLQIYDVQSLLTYFV